MFITTESNFDDSLLFLMAARDAISCAISESSVERKKELKNFIYNEATDYQIMSLLVTGDLPDEKYNAIGEMALFSSLKETLMYNFESLTNVVDPNTINEILQEVGSIFPYQSSKPLMEYAMMLREMDPTAGPAGTGAGATGQALKKMGKTAAKYWKKKGAAAGDEISKGAKAMGKGFSDAGKDIGNTIKNSEVGKGAAAMGKGFADAGKEVGKTVKNSEFGKGAAVMGRGIKGAGNEVSAKIKSMTGGPKATPGGYTPKDISALKHADKLKGGGYTGKDVAALKGAAVKAQDAKSLGRAAASNQQAGSNAMDVAKMKQAAASNQQASPGFLDTIKQKASSAASQVKAFAKTPAGQAIGAAAVAAVLIYGSYKLYKNFLSKSARACAGAGAGKAACMAQQKVKAFKMQIADLKMGSKACAKASNPQKCQAAIANKISKLQAKASKA